MDEDRRVPDEEKGEINHHGRDLSISCSLDVVENDASTATVTICASPTSTGEKIGKSSTTTSSSTKSSQRLSLLRRLTSLWRSPARKVIVKEVHNTPIGYPRLAAFLDSDDNFMLYRRFGYLQSRVLLEQQDDLRQLEEELEMLDEQDVKEHEDILKRRDLINLDEVRDSSMSTASSDTECIEEDNSTRRKKVFRLIASNLKDYGQMLNTAQAFVAMNKPTSSEQCSVRNWMENVDPVFEADASFIKHTEDLITLRPGREHAWLDAGVERVLKGCKITFIQNLFRSRETRLKTDGSGSEVYFTRQRIERLVVVIITAMILALLIVPIWLLYHITGEVQSQRSTAICIGILLVFTLAFSACISLFTRAKRHEILAAAAGYCAVLVVFLGNVNGGFGGSYAPH